MNGCIRQNAHSDHGVSGRQSIGESINSPCAVIHTGVLNSGSRPNTARHQDTHTHTYTRGTATCVCEHTCALHTLTGDNLCVVHQHTPAPSAHHAKRSEHAWCVCVCACDKTGDCMHTSEPHTHMNMQNMLYVHATLRVVTQC